MVTIKYLNFNYTMIHIHLEHTKYANTNLKYRTISSNFELGHLQHY